MCTYCLNSESDPSQPELDFLGVDAGHFDSPHLFIDRTVTYDLSKFLFELGNVTGDVSNDGSLLLSAHFEFSVNRQVLLMSSIDLEWEGRRSTDWLVEMEVPVLLERRVG